MKLWGVLLLVALPCLAAGPAPEKITMEGSYKWTQGGDSGDLRAAFTQTKENQWRVAFYFRFDGQNHIYRGTAQGNPSNGRLEGTVKNDNQRRTFTFEGTADKGVFSGSHAETTRGREKRTGTLTLTVKN